MSWSSPVIATVVNIPARNCFQKYLVSLGSSKNQMRLIGLSAMLRQPSARLNPAAWHTDTMHSTTQPSMQIVWSMSVQTRERTPPRKV